MEEKALKSTLPAHSIRKFISIEKPEAFHVQLGKECLLVSGKDAGKFLSGQLSNEIKGLPIGTSNQHLLLTSKGRIISQVILLRQAQERFLLWSPSSFGASRLYEHLDRFHFVEDLKLEIASELYQPVLLGGSEWPTSFQSLEISLPEQGKGTLIPFGEGSWLSSISLLTEMPTYIAWIETEQLSSFQEFCTMEQLSQAAFSELRTKQNWYHDIEIEGLLVHEAGLELSHVSFTKGCYIGQEVVARTHHRGRANKGLFLVCSEKNESKIELHSEIVNEKDKKVGTIRAVWSLSDHSKVYRAIIQLKSIEQQQTLWITSAQKEEKELLFFTQFQ